MAEIPDPATAEIAEVERKDWVKRIAQNTIG